MTNQNKMAYMPQSKRQEHITPDRVWCVVSDITGIPAIICKEEIFHDPCPVGTPYKAPIFFNGLYGDWRECNYVNPPYEVKTLRRFYQKAKEQAKKGRWSIMLLPSKTDQDWFHDIIKNDFRVEWIEGRLRFKNNKDQAMGGHFLVVIR